MYASDADIIAGSVSFSSTASGSVSGCTFSNAVSVYSGAISFTGNTIAVSLHVPLSLVDLAGSNTLDDAYVAVSTGGSYGDIDGHVRLRSYPGLTQYRLQSPSVTVVAGGRLTIDPGVYVNASTGGSSIWSIEEGGVLEVGSGATLYRSNRGLTIHGEMYASDADIIAGSVSFSSTASGSVSGCTFASNMTIYSTEFTLARCELSGSRVISVNDCQPVIVANAFLDTTQFVVTGDPSLIIDLANNYWGTAGMSYADAAAAIESRITHQYDDSARPLAIYEPFWLDGPPATWLQVLTPSTDSTLREGDPIDIRWAMIGSTDDEVELFLDPDLGPTPWDDGGADGERYPSVLTSPDGIGFISWESAGVPEGVYSIWARMTASNGDQTYSRARGTVTITAFQPTDEPAVTQIGVDGRYADFVLTHHTADAPNLVLVTHGFNGLGGYDPTERFEDSQHAWVTQMADGIQAHLANAGVLSDWDIGYVDWRTFAGRPLNFGAAQWLPGPVALNGHIIGRYIGEHVLDRGYQQVVLIGHSAGAWLIDGVSDSYIETVGNSPYIELDLLDAFVMFDYRTYIGETADRVFNVFSSHWNWVPIPIVGMPPLPHTQRPLPIAFNVDVSCRHDQFVDSGEYFGDHSVPPRWFLESVFAADAVFMDDYTYRGPNDAYYAPLGFKMSRAYQGNPQPSGAAYPNSPETVIADCIEDGALDRSGVTYVPYRDTLQPVPTAGSGYGLDGDDVILTGQPGGAWFNFVLPPSARGAEIKVSISAAATTGAVSLHWRGAQLDAFDFSYLLVPDALIADLPLNTSLGNDVISIRFDGGVGETVRVSGASMSALIAPDVNGDGAADSADLCAWSDAPIDLDNDGLANLIDLQLLADALGLSEEDSDGNGRPDDCERCGMADLVPPFGHLDFFDVQQYLNWYSSGDLRADFAPDGFLDFFDVQMFLSEYASGCED